MKIDWRQVFAAVASVIAILWGINELLFEGYMPKDKARAAHLQLQINRLRYDLEAMSGDGPTSAELEQQLSRLREERDRLLGLH